MDREVFGTSLDIAQVALAVLSLAGGTAAGAVAAARMRMHFQDRRHLLDRLLLEVKALVFTVPLEVGPLAVALHEADRRADLLPWLDRSTWARARRLAPITVAESRIIAAGLDANYSITDACRAGKAKRRIDNVAERWNSWQHAGKDEGFDGLRRFEAELQTVESHLHRALRTGLFRRVRGVPHRIDHYLRGPWGV
jgi:hypothetical protein